MAPANSGSTATSPPAALISACNRSSMPFLEGCGVEPWKRSVLEVDMEFPLTCTVCAITPRRPGGGVSGLGKRFQVVAEHGFANMPRHLQQQGRTVRLAQHAVGHGNVSGNVRVIRMGKEQLRGRQRRRSEQANHN